MFRDEAEIHVCAGNGGDGCISFRHEKCAPRGGPDGGDGGHGGDVIIRAAPNCQTLLDLVRKRKHRARNGMQGGSCNCSGKSALPLIIPVPPGTLIKGENGEILADLKDIGEEILIARGGKGGKGNTRFARSDFQTPRIAEDGEEGESKHLFLELKLIADVGLVGFPNAGKSTLISRISAARPAVADYPFTTLEPHPGIVEFSEYRRLVFADIPGIIEGAHRGVGLGHKFLRHIERTRLLVYLLDIAPLSGPDAAESFRILRGELRSHSEKLGEKPFVVAANKMDLTDAPENLARLREDLPFPVWPISAVTGQGIPEFLATVLALVESQPREE